MKILCNCKVLLTRRKALFFLATWLLAAALLVMFLFCGDAILLVLGILFFLSRARTCASYTEAFRRSMTNPKKPIFFALYMLLPVAEIQYFVQGCEEMAVCPFWLRIPLHSNTAIAEAITEASPYPAIVDDDSGAITIDSPAGRITSTIARDRCELYLFLSGESNIAEDVPLPSRWSREYFSQEYADEYSIECEIAYCPFATIEELAGMIVFQINRLVYATGKGD